MSDPSAQADDELVVHVARKIVTMGATNPVATAVAVRGDRIVSVRSLESRDPWLSKQAHGIDHQCRGRILLPGLIDPHLHPMLGALRFGTIWITPEAWTLHDAVYNT